LLLPLPLLRKHKQKPVISTEAAHSFTVSSGVEKSASPPQKHKQKPVISTEATHSLTVTSGVEKSASLPTPYPAEPAPSHLLLLLP
jgi:hypothetical protein